MNERLVARAGVAACTIFFSLAAGCDVGSSYQPETGGAPANVSGSNSVSGAGATSTGGSSAGAGHAGSSAGGGVGGATGGSSGGGGSAGVTGGTGGAAGSGGLSGSSNGGGMSGSAGSGGQAQVVPPLDLDQAGAYVRTGFTATAMPDAKPMGQRNPPNDEQLDTKNAFDGSLQTRWATGVYQVGGEVFIVDMKQLVKLSRITVDPGAADELDCAGKEDIYLSNDGIDFGTAVVKDHVPVNHLDTIQLPSQQTARYIKFVNTKIVDDHHWWAFGELNVFP